VVAIWRAPNYTEVWLWDTGSATDVLGQVHSSPVGALVFSPDGSTLACGQHNGRIVLDPVNRPSSDPIILPYDSKITALAFTPDGSTLASGTTFGRLMLWK
jgi:WD40 repeat protein